jgi:hypothetical protein
MENRLLSDNFPFSPVSSGDFILLFETDSEKMELLPQMRKNSRVAFDDILLFQERRTGMSA